MNTQFLLLAILLVSIESNVNSFILKRNDKYSNDIQDVTKHRVVQSESIDGIKSTDYNMNPGKNINKRDADEPATLTEVIEVNNNEDPFDFVFPKDDFYGYQPEKISYEVEYVTENNTTKARIKTRFDDYLPVRKLPETEADSKTTEPSTTSTTTTTETVVTNEPTTEPPAVDEITTTVEIDTSDNLTFLDSDNGYGLHEARSRMLEESKKVNEMKQSIVDPVSLYWSKLRNLCQMKCMKSKLNLYNPVCGSDGLTYWNEQKLSCVNLCGRSVTKLYNFRCPGTSLRIII